MVKNKKYFASTSGVYIGRPSKFGNPFVIGKDGTREEVVEKYRQWILSPEQRYLLKAAIKELKGKDLICWCAPLACHGDVLLRIINGREANVS